MKRVLVTGATGFIGSESLAPLIEHGYEVHALHIRQPLNNEDRITWHGADLLEAGRASKLCSDIRPTHLLHFAWHVNPSDYKISPENDRWRDATLDLARAFCEQGGSRAVFAGTCMEYDWSKSEVRLSEYTSPVNPSTVYGRAKDATRRHIEQMALQYHLSCAWGRIFNLYGPREAPARLVPQIIQSLESETPPPITSGGFVRDYSYVADTAGAFVALLDGNVEGIVNVGSGIPITLKEIAIQIAQLLNKEILVKDIPESASAHEPERIVADVSRLREEVGWHPHYDLKTGLSKTIRWWEEQRSGV